MKVINLFGCPSAGKTTAAHALTGYLKSIGAKADFSSEFCKELIYSGNEIQFENQIFINALQYKKLHDMNRYGLDIVVTDAPLQLQKYYNQDKFYYKELSLLIDKLIEEFENYNVLIKRVKPFNPHGRVTDEEHAIKTEKELLKQRWDMIVDGSDEGNQYLFTWANSFILT